MSDLRLLADKCRLFIDDNGTLLLVRTRTPAAVVSADKTDGRAARRLDDEPTRLHVPLLMRPWIKQVLYSYSRRRGSHSDAPYARMILLAGWHDHPHAVVASSLSTVPCAKVVQTDCVGPSSLPPCRLCHRVAERVANFGPLSVTPQGKPCVLLFTDRLSQRAGMHIVSDAELTAEGTADILVNR